eukprot:gb/GFBE01002586.1/.p1 GENE.gb/GFBE01002586.1/~~gb/GFBE01002586.1/.p1  ORF type:complete len:363 (+),score=81.98 gb/GFBE01002586.1/:1-1089(+)
MAPLLEVPAALCRLSAARAGAVAMASSARAASRRGHRACVCRAAAVACLVLPLSAVLSNFVWSPARRAALQDQLWPGRSSFSIARRSPGLARAAQAQEEDDDDILPPRPTPPNSTEAMALQAAEAVMRAYRDGYTRQSVRLNLDAAASLEDSTKGVSYLLKASLPIVKSFATKLWNGEYLREVKASIVDEEVSTLLYREAENPLMDAAVMFLPSRDVVTSPQFTNFFDSMGDRLVVLSNSEQAAANWKVENRGKDFYTNSESGLEICKVFDQRSYYYYQLPFNNWQMTFFRAYPFPWEIYIEDLSYNLVKVGETEGKPTYDQIIAFMDAYEEENGVKAYQKVGKYLKDNQQRPDADANPLAA